MSISLARRERHDLCDLALEVGEDAPTLCGEWTVKQLVAHLLVRENRPWAAAGIIIPPLAGLTERSMERMARRDFGVLVEKLRDPGLSVYRLPPAEVALNTLEYLVHHEDVRRAVPGWEPRELSDADLGLIWKLGRGSGRLMARRFGVPVRIRRSDTGAPGRHRSARRGGALPLRPRLRARPHLRRPRRPGGDRQGRGPGVLSSCARSQRRGARHRARTPDRPRGAPSQGRLGAVPGTHAPFPDGRARHARR